jgi:YihY family inner membrane protein
VVRQQVSKRPRDANHVANPARQGKRTGRTRTWLSTRGPVAFLYHYYWVEQIASDLAAGIAFRLLINLFPLFTVVTTLVAILLRNTNYAQEVLVILLRVFPATWQGQLEDLSAVGQNAGAVSLFGLPLLLWFSTTLLESIGHAFFQHYGIPRQRTLRLRGVGLVLILALSAVLVATVLISSVATWLGGEVADRVGANMQVRNVSVQLMTSLVGYVLAFVLLWALYGRIPDIDLRPRDTWRGALLAATLFVGALQLFPLYLRFRPASISGATVSFIFLLTTWLYLLAHILLLGNALNAFRWRRRLLPPSGDAGIVTDNTPPHGG